MVEKENQVSDMQVFVSEEPEVGKTVERKDKVGQEQIHGLLFGDKLSWQAIIYDLINTEQLDPWDIDLALLANKFLEKVREMEEANLFVSSKVLYAASLLLRIKSEILLNHYLPSLDAILFDRKEEKKYEQERIELEDDIPDLVPRTPLPRHRKVTLQELMAALGKAITTENRRIKKVVVAKQQEIETAVSLPTVRINLKDRIKEVYGRLKSIFSTSKEKYSFSQLAEETGGDRVGTFVPLLHLDNQHKILLEQENHFDEIWIWYKKHFEEKNKEALEKLRREVEEAFAADAEEQEAYEREIKEEKEKKLEKVKKAKETRERNKKLRAEEKLDRKIEEKVGGDIGIGEEQEEGLEAGELGEYGGEEDVGGDS